MKVYEALARAFVDEGTSAVFGIMGDANQYWLDAVAKLGVSLFNVRHEGAGLAMADGWARISGRPGVCTTTSGPGTAQLATTMIVASRAQTPLVAFCGDTARGVDSYQGLNQERFAVAIECGFVRVAAAANAYDAVRKAFYLARHEHRPVMLSAPTDVQQQQFEDTPEYEPSTALLTSKPAHPNPEALQQAADIVGQSKRPVIIVGRGAMAAVAGDVVVKLAARIGALIATSLLAMNWLRDAYDYHAGISGHYSTKRATELLQEADCVIAVGASLNHYTTEHGYLYPNAKFIQIDRHPQVVMGDGRSAECYLQADARIGLEMLDAQLEQRGFSEVGYRTAEVKEQLAQALFDPTEYEIEPGKLDPRDVCLDIDQVIPKDMGLIIGTGHYSHFPTMLCTRERPYIVLNKHFGCIGQALITAIGAMLASGKKPAVVIEGDAGFMMHLAEFETAVRYDLPMLVVVFNDQALGMEVQKARAKGLNTELAQISSPELGSVAAALGGRGQLVCTMKELRAALEEFVAQPQPTIIDARISQNVLAIQYRRLWYGQDDV